MPRIEPGLVPVVTDLERGLRELRIPFGIVGALVPELLLDARPARMTNDADVTVVPRIGSLALRLARVAEGALDAAFAGGKSHDWDLAAADLLVHEAGGRMTTLDGAMVAYNKPETDHRVLVAAGQMPKITPSIVPT